ncbi:ATP-binding protein [Ideonella sp. BN130291]|uniref:ATP-binding protein n=1 Tax=Ideonella sp. BN130291 TaxID=3112940 RepID=UPI002E2620EB|nr:BTAD domain-containing putative transcriptional regulator [Ideonella sp. BN130291]
MHLEVFLLGRFEVRCNGVPVTAWGRAGAKRLFKLLALAPQHALPPSRLAAALWPNDYGERVRQRLHHQVYLLRGALDVRGTGSAAVFHDEGLVRLAAGAITLDVRAFDAAAEAALRAGDEAALTAALGLYGGPLLPGDIDDAEFDAQRLALELRHAELLRVLSQRQAKRGALQDAMGSLQQVLQRLPADEAAHRELIGLHAALGRRDDAERQYAACKTALSAELGVAPSAATHQAYRAAMLQEPAGAEPAALPPSAERWLAPVPLVPLIGRDTLAQRLGARLAEPGTRLVTLVGAGGLGKTQLALRVAHELQGRYRHGACFVSLAEVDGDGVADRLRRALRLAEPLTEDSLDSLAERLRDRQLLLVCDNCEHVADRLGLLTALLERAPLLTVLATSRRRLNLRAEQVVEVPPLAATDDEAVRLFAERAHAASPRFVLDAANIADVRAIVGQLQGVPLAIELVAARVGLMPPAALRQALAHSEAVAAGGGPDRPERHRSTQASLAWSHQLLTPVERAVLERAALFVAPFELACLAALCVDVPCDIAQVVQALGDLGLLARAAQHDPAAPPRWQELPGTRAFLRGEAERDNGSAGVGIPGASPWLLRRFAAWYAALAQRLAAGLAAADAGPALAAFDAEHDNFFAALAAADAVDDAELLCRAVQGLAPYWSRTGAWQRAQPWIERAEAAAASLPPADQPTLLLAIAGYWHDAHHHRRAHAWAGRAATRARERGDLALQAQAMLRLSSSAYHLGASHTVIGELEALRAALRDPAHAALRRSALNNVGNGYLCAGDLARASAAWVACDAELPAGTSQARVAYVHNLALVAHYEGRHAQALALLDDALRHEHAGVPRAARLLLIHLRRCWMACCIGQADEAARALTQAGTAAGQARLPGWQLACAAHEGKLALVSGQGERALALLTRAAERRDDLADPWDGLDLLLWLFRAQSMADRPARSGASDAARRTLAALVLEFGGSWRLEQVRTLEAAAGWLLRADAAEAAGRAWQQAQAARRAQGLRRFPVEEATARRTAAGLRSRLGSAGLAACAAPVDELGPLQWLQPWLE